MVAQMWKYEQKQCSSGGGTSGTETSELYILEGAVQHKLLRFVPTVDMPIEAAQL